jgi:hypothetical protein
LTPDDSANCADDRTRAQDRIEAKEDKVAKTKTAAASASKFKRTAVVKTRSRRTARFQSSDWYQKAVRSIGISDNRAPKRREDEERENLRV